jgi:hypothetical protein
MGVPVRNFSDFEAKFKTRRHESDLFAFLLFDSRSSHAAVATFGKKQFDFIDEWAARLEMVFFVWIEEDKASKQVGNPGPVLAQEFGIAANRLPGVLLFTMDGERRAVRTAAFLPIKASVFQDEPERVEQLLAALFTAIQRCRTNGLKSVALLDQLRAHVRNAKLGESLRPFRRSSAAALMNLPTDLLQALSAVMSKVMLGG